MVSLSANAKLDSVGVFLTSVVGSINLAGVSLADTSASVKNCTIIVFSTSGSGTLTGVTIGGTTTQTTANLTMRNVDITVAAGTGSSQGILGTLTSPGSAFINNVDVACTGTTTYGLTTSGSGTVIASFCNFNASTADVFEAAGQITLNRSTLFNSTANGAPFSVIGATPSFIFGAISFPNTTDYLYPGYQSASASSLLPPVTQRINEACVVRGLTVSALTASAAPTTTETFTLFHGASNGALSTTGVSVVLNAGQLVKSNFTTTFNLSVGDVITVQYVADNAANHSTAVVVTVYLY